MSCSTAGLSYSYIFDYSTKVSKISDISKFIFVQKNLELSRNFLYYAIDMVKACSDVRLG